LYATGRSTADHAVPREDPHLSQTCLLEYWQDDDWYVGRLKGVPGVFSQGKTLDELEENIRDAYRMMIEEEESVNS
jgi:predicted RNase H-like HicB family nuclease